MPSISRNIQIIVEKALADYNNQARSDGIWTTKILPNGHIIVLPLRESTWVKAYKQKIKDVNIESTVNIEKLEKQAEERAIQVTALRNFLRPSKE